MGVCLAAAFAYALLLQSRLTARAWYFFAGLAVFWIALTSPLNALAGGYLFSAHMMQHMLLLLIVPLLLLLGLPPLKANAALGWRPWRLTPLAGWAGGVSAMWVWHERTLCDLAARTETGRIIQIISLLALGALFWWPLLGPRIQQRIPPLSGVAYLFSACLACSVLGILITFSPAGAVCPVFLQPPDQPGVLRLIRHDWGVTPAQDQQIGGLLMWVPGCGIYLAGVMAMLGRWYGSAETDEPATPRSANEGHPTLVSTQTHAENH
jgi:putative membrane protein